jgi:hypothetical protein
MHQLRRHHRSHDFKQSAKELGCAEAPNRGDLIEPLRLALCPSTFSIARMVDMLHRFLVDHIYSSPDHMAAL